MTFQEEQALENVYVMHTFARKPVEFVRGEGMLLYDDTNRAYVDFLSGIGVDSLGHAHPQLTRALSQQCEKLLHVSNYYYVEGRGELARRLSDLLNRGNESAEQPQWKTFFTNSGAESNECAIKLARLYARKRAAKLALEAGGDQAAVQAAQEAAPKTIVTLAQSFHGRTLATLAATAQPAKQEAFRPLPAGFISTPINDIAALQTLFEDQGNEICAVLVEVIQGESGVHPCTPEFLNEVRRLTEQTNTLMICDEVQCGIYRTGTYPFAFQHFGVVPDIVSMAKGIGGGVPMGACAAKSSVADAFEPGDHGTTFGGSCLAVAAATTVLSVIEETGLDRKVSEVGAYFIERLSEIPQIVEVRGRGLMVGVDLAHDIDATEVVSAALALEPGPGLVLNAPGKHTLRFLPPLICEKEDIDYCVEQLAGILAALQA